MTYPLALDEMDEAELAHELEARLARRSQGICDYCGRAMTTKPCRFPARHAGKVESPYADLKQQLRDTEDRLSESRATRRFREKVRQRSHHDSVARMEAKLREHVAAARAKQHELYVALKRAEEERQLALDKLVAHGQS